MLPYNYCLKFDRLLLLLHVLGKIIRSEITGFLLKKQKCLEMLPTVSLVRRANTGSCICLTYWFRLWYSFLCLGAHAQRRHTV